MNSLSFRPIAALQDYSTFQLDTWDYVAFFGYFAILSLIGYLAGRKKRQSDDYFLAGRSLPWYVVGCSFIASNISAEQFIGMIGAAWIYGICAAMWEWGNVVTFSILIWVFIPFLLASKVFTTPEFMERRFNPLLRQFFALITVLTNVVAFLAAVMYGGGLALHELLGWNLFLAIAVVGVAAGVWAVYGGLKSVAWMDVFTVVIMIAGGLMVTLFGLKHLGGQDGSMIDGFRTMLERNQADTGIYAEVMDQHAQELAGTDHYDRLSVIQPTTHSLIPWPNLIFMIFTISIWYNVINQFMIQRVLGAKNMYHARMGIVLAGYMKVLLPLITVVPGLILFAMHPEILKGTDMNVIKTDADKGYVHMLQTVIPVGLSGLFLAALFGAIQSTVQSVLNSTSTVFTIDIYKRLLKPSASERSLVWVGRLSTVLFLLLSIALACAIVFLDLGLFEYVQTLYAFFAPPFGAVFLLGILFRRINGAGATAGVFGGFLAALGMKLYVLLAGDASPDWIKPFMTQATLTWLSSIFLCTSVSLLTAPPRAEQVTDQLTLNWRSLNIFSNLGHHWYSNVILWWGVFVAAIGLLILLFSGVWF